MISKIDEIVYNVVLKADLVPAQTLAEAKEKAGKLEVSLVSYLTRNYQISEIQIMKLVAEELKLEYVNLKNIKIEQDVINAVPHRFAWHYRFVPIKIENKVLTIAVTFPLDIKIQDELRMHFRYDIRMVLASEKDILETFAKVYGLGADTIEQMLSTPTGVKRIDEELLADEVEDIDKLAEDASVIKLVNQIILEAYKKRATDIHIEPYRGELKLRYRIDGQLTDAHVPAHIKQFLLPILSRIKIMSNLNIVEHRLPQDGRAIVKIQDQILDLRVSFIPTPFGESVVIRILPTSMIFSLAKLGLTPYAQEIFEKVITKPHGIIFITGPTGSGKTTTLYACLSKINKKENKIITIEDPIEYEMPSVVQIQVMSDIGLTFAKGLRSILRHDPDIIMVGEVRDLETAEIAIRVALTGHLVFSTLHTNDAASGVTRLVDIGVEPFLVASSVEAFIAQRLVRTICPTCKKEDNRVIPELKNQIARELGLSSGDIKLYKGEGCEECGFSGFRGRTAIFEILVMDDALRDMVLKKASAANIKHLAINSGMRTLRQDGWHKVIQGVTTLEEIMRVTPEEKYEDRRNVEVEDVEAKIPVSSPKAKKNDQAQIDDDRRIFARTDLYVSIHWKIYPVDKKSDRQLLPEFSTYSQNISAGGLLFSTHEHLSISQVLELKIDLPNESPIVCLARVVRIEEAELKKGYDVAVCFLDLSGADRQRLNNFIMAGKPRYPQP